MKLQDQRDTMMPRLRLLAVLTSILLATVAAGYWYVQVVQGAYFRALAENNRLRKLPIKAPRGRVFDRQGKPLVENVPSYNLLLNRSLGEDLTQSLSFAGEVLARPAAEFQGLLERYRDTPDVVPVLIAEDLALSQVARFEVAELEYPEFEIEVLHRRLYRHSGHTAHVLGYLGEVSEDELDGNRGALAAGDLVGRGGVEQAYDEVLRGRDGEQVVVVDSRGKLIEEYRRKPSRPGRELTLNLDLDLQQEAEHLLGEQVGAAVALDPRSGAVRALVSSPSYDPNVFARRLLRDQWQQLLESPHHPLQDRAIQSTYAPGSVFKVVLAVAGLSEGVVGEEDTVFCRGSTRLYNHRFRCWRAWGHGRMNLHEALRQSCDVYFYHLGQKLGIERIARYARLFGFGRPTGIDIAGEKPGLVPDPQWSQRTRRAPWFPGETISVAIGQGPLLATPLQMAVMMAAVASQGRLVRPHLVSGMARREPTPVGLDLEALKVVRRALWAVVNEAGTGARARVAGRDVAGKTGTAQVIRQKTWIETETLPYEHRDHAWFASFAPLDSPELVVVVFVEHGGMGSRAAAPIAKALYDTYFSSASRDRESL